MSEKLRKLNNQKIKINNHIKNIDETLKLKADISKDKIIEIYQEAKIVFPQLVKKQLEDIENFNINIIKNRQIRLNTEKNNLEIELKKLESQISQIKKQYDNLIKYLGEHGALEEYTSLNQKLSDYKIELDKLKMYKQAITKFKNNLSQIEMDFKNEDIKTRNYLYNFKEEIDKNILIFKNIANKFYENKISGIEIKNNENKNKLRFDINVKIQGDSSDGVNEVKIFCFDWTLLLAKHNHNINCIFHDSRILSDMDPRQISTLLKLSYETSLKNNLQYILSINENMLESAKEYLTQEEYNNVINSNILELTDKNEKSKLLGIQIDLNYEKN